MGADSAGSWTGLAVDYTGTGADASGISEAALSVVGIDRDDDAGGATIDVDASDDVADVSIKSDGQQVVIELGGFHSIKAGDEVVVRYGPGIRNPAVAGNSKVPIQVNPKSSGGQTMATLQVGSDRATVLFDDQTTTGKDIDIQSVRVPNGGFVVVHDKKQLEVSGAAASVVGHSPYLEQGSHTGVTVMLSETVKSDRQYVAMVHKDNGNQAYDFPDGDPPYKVQSNPVVETATLTVKTPTPTQSQKPNTAADSKPTKDSANTATATNPATTAGNSPGFGVGLAILALICVGMIGLLRS